MMEYNRVTDYSALKPGDKKQDVEAILRKGIAQNYGAICVRPCDIDLAVKLCEGTDTTPCCVLDFPHGCGGWEAKAAMAEIYAKKGIKEIDMVMNYGFARSGLWDDVAREIRVVVEKAHTYGALVKVIFEIGYLSTEEIVKATEVCIDCGADYIKTCTGFFEPVTEEAVQTMVKAAGGRVRVKVSGPGITDLATAEKYVAMGADRLGIGYVFSDKIMDEYLGKAVPTDAGEIDPNEY